jgi:hypothetical protein
MSDLVDETPAATEWLRQTVSNYETTGHFGEITSSIIWSNALGSDGKPIVDIDPDELVASINANTYPVLLGHDPGHPLGKLLKAAAFKNPSGMRFVAAVMGLYLGRHLSFSAFGFDSNATFDLPKQLPRFTHNLRISLAVDQKEVSSKWLKNTLNSSPIEVKVTPLSNNAQDSFIQLIRVGLPYILLVWNPFVTTIAEEAGKDAYALMRKGLIHIVERVSSLENPVLDIQSYQDRCRVSFILRGNDIQSSYIAMEKISEAAVQADHLIKNMEKLGEAPKVLVYEFDKEDQRWLPSYAELMDGRLVTDSQKLIVVGELPRGLSLGLTAEEGVPFP